MKKWNELTEKEQNRIAYDWIQCEGYTDEGEETDSAEEYYYATHTFKALRQVPFQKGDLDVF